MRIAFLTEMGFQGKVSSNHPNMRTEFAWMYALDADHFNINNFDKLAGYDHVFIIFPKGQVYLNAFADKLADGYNSVSILLQQSIVDKLKAKNNKVHFVQEGPHWLWNDYDLPDQILYYNMIATCDSIFAHNEHDTVYYRGLYPNKPVRVLDTLMIETLIDDIEPIKQDKVIIGGNFARWYGGFESYITAQEFEVPVWGQTSHATRPGEDQLINHLPRVMWNDWMKALSEFKYAVHLMPTVAAGTFSLNCAYFGIPCIGNRQVDTQKLCHPALAVDVYDIDRARELARLLKSDKSFYEDCSYTAKQNYKLHYSLDNWKANITSILND